MTILIKKIQMFLKNYEVGGPELMTLASVIGDSDCKSCQRPNK